MTDISASADRIAFFLPSLSGGGAERVLVTLASSLARRGHSVDFILCSCTGPYLKELDERVNIVDLNTHRALAAVIPLLRYLRRVRPRSLVSSLMHSNVVAALAITLDGRNTRLVLREANTLGAEGRRNSLKDSVLLKMVGWAYRRADVLVAVSQGVLDQMVRVLHLPARVEKQVILNPVIDERLRVSSRLPVFPKWPWDDGRPVVLGVGRLVPAKDFPTLLEAFTLVNRVRPSRLIILGEGPERELLQAQSQYFGVSDSVWMPGFVDNPFAHMRCASVFVLASRFEGLPNALIQAMACGTPVVATRCPSGPDEILENGRLGALVEVGDAQAMAAAILDILEGRTGAKGLSDNRYDVEVVTDQYQTLILGAVTR